VLGEGVARGYQVLGEQIIPKITFQKLTVHRHHHQEDRATLDVH
jgi:hypothetical protein